MKEISLIFDGYWPELHKDSIPCQSGIYCVYACTRNAAAKTVSLRKLLYTGESTNVHARLQNHDRLPDWKRYLHVGETLCYSFSAISGDDRVRAEAAMINRHKPPCNTEYMSSFPYYTTQITTGGQNRLLDSAFIVNMTL